MKFLQPNLMTSLQPAEWHDLFVAIAGAAAALTGLLLVAVSINLKRILDFPSLPTRAAETLSIVLGLLLATPPKPSASSSLQHSLGIKRVSVVITILLRLLWLPNGR